MDLSIQELRWELVEVNKETKKIDPSKFNLVHTEKDFYKSDDILTTKSASYYRDAFNRFKRNKSSVIAAIILGFIIFFTIFGPYFKKYDLIKTNPAATSHFKELPPKIPGLEHFGIFNGTKTLNSRDKEFIESLPEGIVKKVHRTYDDQGRIFVDIKVDYYKYLEYVTSHGTGLTEDRQTTYSLTKQQYEEALENNAIIELLNVSELTGVYTVRMDIFKNYFKTDAASTYFWFGTDSVGGDLFTILWEAARVSILMAVVITIINTTVGVLIGSIIGYYGGTLDIVADRIVDVLANLPFMAILTILLLTYGNSLGVIVVAFTATGWIGSYSTTRMQFYRYKNREYVLAARSYGASDSRIMYKHILPNAIGTLITSFSLSIPAFIFTESTYSFLGIINYSDATSIGRLLSNGQEVMQNHYHLLLFPAIFISVLMLSFNMFGNGLRDAFNPSLRGAE